MFLKTYSSEKTKEVSKYIIENCSEIIKKRSYAEINLNSSVSEVNSSELGVKDYLRSNLLPECNSFLTDYLSFYDLVSANSYDFSHFSIMHQKENFNIPYHYDSEVLKSRDGVVKLRNFAMLLFLNDDFDGGELHFPLQKFHIKPKSGTVVVFPTSFMFPHVTNPSMGNDRYTIRVAYNFDLSVFKG